MNSPYFLCHLFSHFHLSILSLIDNEYTKTFPQLFFPFIHVTPHQTKIRDHSADTFRIITRYGWQFTKSPHINNLLLNEFVSSSIVDATTFTMWRFKERVKELPQFTTRLFTTPKQQVKVIRNLFDLRVQHATLCQLISGQEWCQCLPHREDYISPCHPMKSLSVRFNFPRLHLRPLPPFLHSKTIKRCPTDFHIPNTYNFINWKMCVFQTKKNKRTLGMGARHHPRK